MQNNDWTIRKIKEFTEYLGESNGKKFMEVVRDLIRLDPFDGHKFYIFSFIKLHDRQRFHQPRLTKPHPVPGSTLLRVDPKRPEDMKMCWTLPSEEAFHLYKDKKLFADQFVFECIQTYLTNPRQLFHKEADDVSDEDAIRLYGEFRRKIARMDKESKETEESLKKTLEKINSSCGAVSPSE